MSDGMITMWRGQNVDDMTREQAIEALKVCAKILTDVLENTIKNVDSALKSADRLRMLCDT